MVLVALLSLVWTAGASAAVSPALVGHVSDPNLLSGTTSVAVSGNYAYTTAYYAGRLTVVDISDPTNPQIVGETPSASSLENGSTVNIAGHYAYVASKNANASMSSNDDGTGNALTVVDISNPTSPQIVGSVHDSSKLFGAYGIAVSGHYAFVASQGLLSGQPTAPDTSSGSFSVIDLNNLSAGVVANIDNGSLPGSWAGTNALEHATSVAISGSYAYVTAFYSSRLTVINISNPLSPSIVASLSSPQLAFAADVAVQGNDAYVADQTGGSANQFTVVNVSSPASPTIVGGLSNGTVLNGAYRIRLHGNFAYLSASSVATVAAIDISNPASPVIAGSVTDASNLNVTTGLDVDPTGRFVIASSARLPGETRATYPPYPLQAGGPTDTGTISVIQLNPAPISVTPPTISGQAQPGASLTATSGHWSAAPAPSFSYQWERCDQNGQNCAPITGAMTSNYTVQSGDAGSTLEVSVTATNTAGASSASSAPSSVVGSPPVDIAGPTISGTAAQDKTLAALPGTWMGYPAPSFAYRWQRCDQNGQNCSPVAGATSSTYTTVRQDVGATLEVTVTATNSAGSVPAASGPTGRITGPPAPQTPPRISGTAQQGQQLRGINGGWSGYPAPTFTYRWERCQSNGGHCSTIAGQTAARYTVTVSDVGHALRFVVIGTSTSGSSSAASLATSAVTLSRKFGPLARTQAARLAGISRGTAGLHITLVGADNAALLDRVAIALPRGMSFRKSRTGALKGISVREPRGPHVRVREALVRGSLVLTMGSPAESLQLVVGGPALAVSKRLAGSVKTGKTRTVAVTLTVSSQATRATTRIRLQLRVS